GQSSVEWDGRQVPFHQIRSLLSKETSADRRRKLYLKQQRLIASINDLRAERLEKMHQLAGKLGYENYLDMQSRLHRVDYSALDSDMQRLLAETDRIYTTKLEKMLARNMGLPLSEAERADTFYFARLREFDDLFPAAELLSVYRKTMEDLGISV